MADEVKILDAAAKQAVVYAVPLWLRDEQIRVNTRDVAGRIEPHYEPRAEPIAIVCYGPSLAQTWEQVRNFRYVMTCSGAHRFLLDRAIVPTHHCEVDPRAHKTLLIGQPHPGVEYLIASACSPKLFAHLAGFRVRLWHVFDASDEGQRLLPPGEWSLFGGCGAGLRAMVLANFLGFSNLHIFGMDGNESDATGKHAGPHPSQPKGHSLVEYPPASGVWYKTTPALLEAARQTWHELDQLPGVTATFYGDGLVQAMAKDYVPNKLPPSARIGVCKPELISAEYRDLNRQLHETNLGYGVGGSKHAETVQKMVGEMYGIRSVLDYGAGKGHLAKSLPFPIWEYDPAVPGKEESPKPADLVVCSDVLEHIEPDRLPFVLGDLRRCVLKIGYFVIHTGPAAKTLADGRNTHLIQEDRHWWKATLRKFFKLVQVTQKGPELYIVVQRKPKQAETNHGEVTGEESRAGSEAQAVGG